MKRAMNQDSQLKLSEICEGISTEVQSKIKDLIEQDNFKSWAAVNELHGKINNLERKVFNQENIIKEQGYRFKSKIMSAYYLMGAVAKMGTHREKEIAIRFIQCTLDDIVKGSNDLSWDQDFFRTDDLPF